LHQRSVVVAWLDAIHSAASVRLSASTYQRCSQLLGRLSDIGLFRPLRYVHWLVAHGVLAVEADSLRASRRAKWHRCDATIAHHDLSDAVPRYDTRSESCGSMTAESLASRYLLRQLHPQLVFAARRDGHAASVLVERRLYAHARASCLSPATGAAHAANEQVRERFPRADPSMCPCSVAALTG